MFQVNAVTTTALIMTVPLLAMAPDTGLFIARSRWTTRFFGLAAGIAMSGVAMGVLRHIEARSIVAFFAPVCQLAFLRASYEVFFRLQGRLPANVVLNWSRGLFWDRLFAFAVFMTSVMTFACLTRPQ